MKYFKAYCNPQMTSPMKGNAQRQYFWSSFFHIICGIGILEYNENAVKKLMPIFLIYFTLQGIPATTS
jgi:hypothetical protein